jgi:hypothetical protein
MSPLRHVSLRHHPMPSAAETNDILAPDMPWVTYPSNFQAGHSSVPAGAVDPYGHRQPPHEGPESSTPSTLLTNTVPAWAIEQYGQKDVTQPPHSGPGSPTPSASPTNTHSERTGASSPIVEYYEHRGQPQIIFGGSGTSRPSTSTEWRLRSVSDRSSGLSFPIDQNEHRVASPPVLTSDTPPAYSV